MEEPINFYAIKITEIGLRVKCRFGEVGSFSFSESALTRAGLKKLIDLLPKGRRDQAYVSIEKDGIAIYLGE